ncbi:MAG: caspase family protein [Cyclobacteriaceae bacterium]
MKINRRVIMLTNPGKNGESNYCPGVYVDQRNYFSYFTQPYGGYWSSSELRHFDKPSKQTVYKELDLIKQDDIEFSIIIFCGHGWYSSRSNSNILVLNDLKEEMDSLDLRIGSNKRIIILDNCREVHDQYISENLVKGFSADALRSRERKTLNPEVCRALYNKTISDSPGQIINSYACGLNEYAGDSSTLGGYYSSSLLGASKDWAENEMNRIDLSTKYSILNFPIAHNQSVPIVQRLSANKQNPQIDKPRSANAFLPFAIVA